jgi:prepilin-type N-terminal cleavage/methylation domain-containing protein
MIMTAQVRCRAAVGGVQLRELAETTRSARSVPENAVKQRLDERGFTLVELIIAIVLVGILTAVAIVGLGGLTKSGDKSQCKSLLGAAQSAASTYYANTGAYARTSGSAPIGFDALMAPVGTTPAVLTLPSNVNHSGNVMSTSSWSITMGGGGGITPNTFTKTGGGTACS